MAKERKLTIKELHKLHTICGAWLRENEGLANRKESVAEIRAIQHKLFWLYNERP